MKTHPFRFLHVTATLLLGSCMMLSCSDDDDGRRMAPPEVTSVSPAQGPKATVVTIQGTNFSTTLAENKVTFNGKIATVTAATNTQLIVSVPPAADSGPIVVTTNSLKAANQPAFTFHWTVVTLAGSSQGYVDGSPAKFNAPSGIAADSLGNTYVTDFANHVIRKTTSAGVVSTVAGSTPGVADGLTTSAKFYYPNGSTIDKLGN
ncbi:MAG TPA: IPT/TIG domain-containing protein, partial [Chryseolinea sp.]